MSIPITSQSTAPRRIRRAPARPLSVTERGRMVALLVKLERQWPELEVWHPRHVTALLANLLSVYGRGSIA